MTGFDDFFAYCFAIIVGSMALTAVGTAIYLLLKMFNVIN